MNGRLSNIENNFNALVYRLINYFCDIKYVCCSIRKMYQLNTRQLVASWVDFRFTKSHLAIGISLYRRVKRGAKVTIEYIRYLIVKDQTTDNKPHEYIQTEALGLDASNLSPGSLSSLDYIQPRCLAHLNAGNPEL